MEWDLFVTRKLEYHGLIVCFCVEFYNDETPYLTENYIIVVVR